ncbi:MAG: SPASM domain-containing protein [Peptostreptococcus sp.]|uniref:radical SAM/SPASM domain-containing protein n=1 Tax=Peptostreptococcus sp. TaxID=1262 RepID=UPI002FCBF3EE
MKLSKFNIEHKIKEGLLLYNTLTSSIVLLENDDISKYNNLKSSDEFPRTHIDLINELIDGGIIVSDNFNEFEYIKYINTVSRYKETGLRLTIAPTLNCNFACPYCFENGVVNKTMSNDIISKVIDFIGDKLSKDDSLSITWYGGEPLMSIDIIEKITTRIFEQNKEIKKNYFSDIITNGYLLDKEMALKLKNLGVNSAQITLDGPPEIHDKRRYLTSGGETFFTILNNLKESCDILDLVIRINIDKSNRNEIDKLINILKKENLYDKVFIYIAKVNDFSNNANENILNKKEFSEVDSKFLNDNPNYYNISDFNPFVCGAINDNSFIIDPYGDLYKCWDDIGKKDFNVGNISDGVSYNDTFLYYANYNPFLSKDCIECNILPICMGGCPLERKISGKNICRSKKYNIKKDMEIAFLKSNL